MGIFSKIGKALKKVIGVVAAVAAAVFIPGAGAFIGKALLGAAISIGASKLLAKRGADAPAGGDAGGRVQLPPATENKLPIVYGQAWVGGPITDAKISQDQKYMWYCIAFAEKTDTGSYTYDLTNGVYYDGKLVQFGANGVVTGLITNNSGLGTAQVDTRMSGKIYIWLFSNGSTSGVNTGGQSAITIMSDSSTGGGIYPSELRWNGSLYTSNGQSADMTNTAFAIVRVEYNPDAGTTGLGSLQVKLTNNMGATNGARPGDVILDYLQNERYGCAIPLSQIDTGSLTALNAYSNQQITYIDVNGSPQVQNYRYRINGAVNTAATCLNNLQTMVDSCDSWLQYSEATGKWRVVMNAPFVGPESQLFLADSNNIIGGVQINPVDLNETYNQVEVAYPNNNIKDQTDYQVIDLTNPANWSNQNFDDILSPNEATNRLNISLPLINNAVTAKYLAARRLLQSREDIVISCQLDYSGIQIEAGDVIRVGQPDYGWGPISTNPNNPYKLFRVSNVSEQTTDDNSLVANIEAFEYNATVYADNAITDFIPADNTGLTDPNVISKPCPPVITTLDDIATPVIDAFQVETCVPDEGTVLYMDFNYGTDSNVQTHQLYRTIQSAGGIPFTNSDSANAYFNTISITVNDLAANTYYWSATARNDTAGRYSDGSASYTWGGASIQPYNPDTTRGGLPGTSYRPNSIPASAIAGGVGGTIRIQDEGTNVVSVANVLNFTGSGVLVSSGGANTATINVPGYYYSLGSASFQVPNEANNTVLLPVDVTSTTTRNIPVYITGTDPGANYYYPYFQGTSTTANYYLANSTAAMQGAFASSLEIQDGDDNWYNVLHANFSQTVNAGNTLIHNYVMQLVSDTDNTIVQVVPGITIATTTTDRVFTPFMHTINLNANLPYLLEATRVPQTWSPFSIDGGGLWVRNLTAGSTVYILLGQYIGRGPL
jgi:hypothetical protein